jgi:hypothetical protein
MPPTMGGPTEARQGRTHRQGAGRGQRRRKEAAYVWREPSRPAHGPTRADAGECLARMTRSPALPDGEGRKSLPYQRSVLCRSKTASPSRSRMRKATVLGGNARFAAATIAADTSDA